MALPRFPGLLALRGARCAGVAGAGVWGSMRPLAGACGDGSPASARKPGGGCWVGVACWLWSPFFAPAWVVLVGEGERGEGLSGERHLLGPVGRVGVAVVYPLFAVAYDPASGLDVFE